MKRLLPGVWWAVSCGLMSIVLLGCPGTLDRGVGVDGMGGSTGNAGCEAAVFASACAGCHTMSGGSAGLDLQSANPGARLLGIPSSTDSTNGSACPGKTLLDANSNPATGFFIDKITPGTSPLCGSAMPIGPALSSDQVTCLKTWATSVTSNSQAFIQEDNR